MDKKEFISVIKDLLNLEDFKAVSTGAGSVSLKNKNVEILIPYLKYPGVYRFRSSIIGVKSFSAVNLILEKHFANYNLPFSPYTIHKSSRSHDDYSLIDLKNLADVKLNIQPLKEMVNEDLIPFFRKYEDLITVHEELEELEVNTLSHFIYSPIHPRIMVIKRLVNAHDWESFCEDSLALYKEQSEGKYKAAFAPVYAFLPDLYEELQNLDPSQIIQPSAG